MPNMFQCQITRSTRFAQQVDIIKPNPTTNANPNPNHLTEEINKHLCTRLCEITHTQCLR